MQSAAFADLCAAVTVECGKPGNQNSEIACRGLLEAALHLEHLPQHPVPKHDIELYHTIGIVKVPEEVGFTFGDGDAEIRFETSLDHMNFRDLSRRHTHRAAGIEPRHALQVMDEDGRESSSATSKCATANCAPAAP